MVDGRSKRRRKQGTGNIELFTDLLVVHGCSVAAAFLAIKIT